MIEGTNILRESFGGSFKDYRQAALKVREITRVEEKTRSSLWTENVIQTD